MTLLPKLLYLSTILLMKGAPLNTLNTQQKQRNNNYGKEKTAISFGSKGRKIVWRNLEP